MLIIVDHKIPDEAKKELVLSFSQDSGVLMELETDGLVYPAISGHPDIFFCQAPQTLVVSPNLPERYLNLLDQHKITYVKGHIHTGEIANDKKNGSQSIQLKQKKAAENKAMTCYNAAINNQFLVHRLEYTEPVILENCHFLKKIAVKQGYTRCNLMLLKDSHYITSDQGIDLVLKSAGLNGLYVSPENIVLPGFPNGFIGGAMGLYQNSIYFTGSLKYLPGGEEIAAFIKGLGYRVTELYDGPLFDGGGILFI